MAAAAALLILGLAPHAFAASQLTCTPQQLRFGNVVVGEATTLPVAVTNSGPNEITISGVALSNSAFAAAAVNMPMALPAGQTVEMNFTFTPTSDGWVGGSLRFTSNASSSYPCELSGTGTGSAILTASPMMVSFGSVSLGSSVSVPVVLTNTRSWRVVLSVLQEIGVGYTISAPPFPLTLEGGQSVTIYVDFSPESAGLAEGIVYIGGGGPALAIPVTGTGAAAAGHIVANPATLSFGNVQAGSTATMTDSFKNTGTSTVTISQATVSGAGFTLSGLNPPVVLNPGASVTFNVEFAPSSGATASGALAIASNAVDPNLGVSLTGTGMAPGTLIVAPTAINFGKIVVGKTSTQTSSLSASGADVMVTAASVSGSEFAIGGVSFPLTISAGSSVPVTLSFTPQSAGSASAVVTVASNASNSAAAQDVSGVGEVATPHSVSLAWTESTAGVAGFNVYRSNAAGGPYSQINSGLATSTSYSDTTVQPGETYYYVTTAVETGGTESAYSNEAQGVIPTP